jgi:hypothetical protein
MSKCAFCHTENTYLSQIADALVFLTCEIAIFGMGGGEC